MDKLIQHMGAWRTHTCRDFTTVSSPSLSYIIVNATVKHYLTQCRILAQTHSHTHTHTHISIHTCMHVHIHTHTCIHTYTHTHTYIHAHITSTHTLLLIGRHWIHPYASHREKSLAAQRLMAFVRKHLSRRALGPVSMVVNEPLDSDRRSIVALLGSGTPVGSSIPDWMRESEPKLTKTIERFSVAYNASACGAPYFNPNWDAWLGR